MSLTDGNFGFELDAGSEKRKIPEKIQFRVLNTLYAEKGPPISLQMKFTLTHTYRMALESLAQGKEAWRRFPKQRRNVRDHLDRISVVWCSMPVLRRFKNNNLINKIGPYLYEGTGKPWAGHRRVIAPPRDILNACKSASVGNFGRALATGSTRTRFAFQIRSERTGNTRYLCNFNSRKTMVIVLNLKLLYLNAGTGNAWAGQKSVCECPWWILKSLLVSDIGNFGRVLATGSEKSENNAWIENQWCFTWRLEQEMPALDRRASMAHYCWPRRPAISPSW